MNPKNERLPRRDFDNPIDLIVEMIKGRLRRYGTQVVTGVVLIVGLAIAAAAFVAPLAVAALVIAGFGLAVEPYKWLGTVLIGLGFLVGVVAAPLALRRVFRRSHRIIALTEFGEDDPGLGFDSRPSQTVSPGPSDAERAATLRVLDDRLAPPSEAPSSEMPGPQTPR